jgi:hypothetical protein
MARRMSKIFYTALGVAYLVSMPTSVAIAQAVADPMRPANAPRAVAGPAREAAPTGARLTAVFFNGQRRVAVVDGRVVKEGDQLRDGVVAEIAADSVRIARGGQSHTLKIPKSTVPVRVRTTVENEP